MEFKEFLELLSKSHDKYLCKRDQPLTDDLVRSVEEKMGITFSAQYLAFCRMFDYVILDDMEIRSIFSDDCVGVDGVLEYRREEGFPEHWLPLHAEELIVLDFSVLNEQGEPRVVEVDYVDLDGEHTDDVSGMFAIIDELGEDLYSHLLETLDGDELWNDHLHKQKIAQLFSYLATYRDQCICDYFSLFYIKPDKTLGVHGVVSNLMRPAMQWRNLAAVDRGWDHVVALKRDWTVVATGDNSDGRCNTGTWRRMQAVIAKQDYTIGLREDRTVCFCGNIDNDKRRRLSAWRDVVHVCAGELDVFGLRVDGTVVSTCFSHLPFDDWRNIIQLAYAGTRLYGLTADFRVCSCVVDSYSSDLIGPVDDWDQVAAIFGSDNCIFGVQCDGTVLCAGGNPDLRERVARWENVISMTSDMMATYAITADGKALELYSSYKPVVCNTDQWKDIFSVHAGLKHGVALCKDGTVVGSGDNADGQCDVLQWSQIIALALGANHTVGLRSDGTVVAVGSNDQGQCNVSGWRNVVGIVAYGDMTAGVCRNGTVVYAGTQYAQTSQLRYWSGIRSIQMDIDHIAGFTEDGRVMLCHLGNADPDTLNTVAKWNNICQLACCREHIIGRTTRGKVLVAGPRQTENNNYVDIFQAEKWSKITQIAGTGNHVLGVHTDGRVFAVGSNEFGATEISAWSGIKKICANTYSTVGLKLDGTVMFCGSDQYGISDISYWRDVVDIHGNDNLLLGLRMDGTVLSAGNKRDMRFDLSELDVTSNDPTPAERIELERIREQERVRSLVLAGRCRYCGGKLGLLKKCTSCKLRN